MKGIAQGLELQCLWSSTLEIIQSGNYFLESQKEINDLFNVLTIFVTISHKQ